jgi:hypothetical protein
MLTTKEPHASLSTQLLILGVTAEIDVKRRPSQFHTKAIVITVN